MHKTLLCLSITFLLAACGGSSSDDNNSSNNSATTPSKLNGTVEQVSHTHITVNDYQLDAQSAEISYDDHTWQLQDIQVGMRLEVETDQHGRAEEIEIAPNLVGEIHEVNADSIMVNGVMVSTTNQTASFSQGDWVFVNGYFNAESQWQTEGIFMVDAITEAEIEGPVSQVTESHFYIGGTQIDFSNARLDDNRIPQNGDWVEVEGTMIKDTFIASEVDVDTDGQYSDMELEGTITWVNHQRTLIELNGRTNIIVSTNTQFEDGSQNDLLQGAKIEVDVISTEQGLAATSIEFEQKNGSATDSNNFALTGTATNVDNATFSINGTIFVTNTSTRFDDGLTLENIANRDIEIEGVIQTTSGDSIYLVKEIEAYDANSHEIDLQGTLLNGTLWGYQATDSSLSDFTNNHSIHVECQLVNMNTEVSHCQLDN